MADDTTAGGPGLPYNVAHVERLRSWLASEAALSEGVMFGVPAFFLRGRLLCCAWGDGVGIRIASASAQSVLGQGCEPFKPFGRSPMPGWVYRSCADGHDLALTRTLLEIAVVEIRGA